MTEDTKILKPSIYRRLLLCAAIALGIGIAAYAPNALAQDFSVGYRADTTMPNGMIVSLVSEAERSIKPSNRGNIDNVLGVVVSGSSLPFNISTSDSNVQIVTSGLAQVLVTDINGVIQTGDHITVSGINGIGMKADRTHSKVIGTAQGDFENPNVQTVQTETGDTQEVVLARVPVLIHIGGNPELASQDSFLPSFIQDTANVLAGRPVAPARIIISSVVITGGLAGSTILLYGAVSSTIISIGRNPLSDKSIYAGLFRMILIALAIILVSCIVAYIIVAAG